MGGGKGAPPPAAACLRQSFPNHGNARPPPGTGTGEQPGRFGKDCRHLKKGSREYLLASVRHCRMAILVCAARRTVRTARRRLKRKWKSRRKRNYRRCKDGVTLGSCPRGEIHEGDSRLCSGCAERRCAERHGAMAKQTRCPTHCRTSRQRHPATSSHLVLPARPRVLLPQRTSPLKPSAHPEVPTQTVPNNDAARFGTFRLLPALPRWCLAWPLSAQLRLHNLPRRHNP